jgi:hypothetical protein
VLSLTPHVEKSFLSVLRRCRTKEKVISAKKVASKEAKAHAAPLASSQDTKQDEPLDDCADSSLVGSVIGTPTRRTAALQGESVLSLTPHVEKSFLSALRRCRTKEKVISAKKVASKKAKLPMTAHGINQKSSVKKDKAPDNHTSSSLTSDVNGTPTRRQTRLQVELVNSPFADFKAGDLVLARFGNGKKRYPGKVEAVNDDGTCRILYDDGDFEGAVERGLIKLVAPSGANEGPGSSTNGKARREVISAKKAASKEAKAHAAPLASSQDSSAKQDEPLDDCADSSLVGSVIGTPTPRTATLQADSVSTSSADLKSGDIVLAQYRGRQQRYSGKVVAVNADETYQISYADGFFEEAVARDLITLVYINNMNEEHSSSANRASTRSGTPSGDCLTRTPTRTTLKLQLGSVPCASKALKMGDLVQAKYRGRQYSGKVAAVNADGTYQVSYDDGDVDEVVKRDLLTLIVSHRPHVTRETDISSTVERARSRAGTSVSSAEQLRRSATGSKRTRSESSSDLDCSASKRSRQSASPPKARILIETASSSKSSSMADSIGLAQHRKSRRASKNPVELVEGQSKTLPGGDNVNARSLRRKSKTPLASHAGAGLLNEFTTRRILHTPTTDKGCAANDGKAVGHGRMRSRDDASVFDSEHLSKRVKRDRRSVYRVDSPVDIIVPGDYVQSYIPKCVEGTFPEKLFNQKRFRGIVKNVFNVIGGSRCKIHFDDGEVFDNIPVEWTAKLCAVPNPPKGAAGSATEKVKVGKAGSKKITAASEKHM